MAAFTFTAIIQGLLSILGGLLLLGGLVALAAGNHQRGFELIVQGVVLIAIRLLIGIVFVGLKHEKRPELTRQKTSERYDQLLTTLNAIKNGKANKHDRMSISKDLINKAEVSSQEKHDLLEQLQKVYNSPSND